MRLDEPDHYSLMTVLLSFFLGMLSTINEAAYKYMPLITVISIFASLSVTIWYYIQRIKVLKTMSEEARKQEKEV